MFLSKATFLRIVVVVVVGLYLLASFQKEEHGAIVAILWFFYFEWRLCETLRAEREDARYCGLIEWQSRMDSRLNSLENVPAEQED